MPNKTPKDNIEEIREKLRWAELRIFCIHEQNTRHHSRWYLDTIKMVRDLVRNSTPKDQVQTECEKYLDEFVDYVDGKCNTEVSRVIYKEVKALVESFKREQREISNEVPPKEI